MNNQRNGLRFVGMNFVPSIQINQPLLNRNPILTLQPIQARGVLRQPTIPSSSIRTVQRQVAQGQYQSATSNNSRAVIQQRVYQNRAPEQQEPILTPLPPFISPKPIVVPPTPSNMSTSQWNPMSVHNSPDISPVLQPTLSGPCHINRPDQATRNFASPQTTTQPQAVDQPADVQGAAEEEAEVGNEWSIAMVSSSDDAGVQQTAKDLLSRLEGVSNFRTEDELLRALTARNHGGGNLPSTIKVSVDAAHYLKQNLRCAVFYSKYGAITVGWE